MTDPRRKIGIVERAPNKRGWWQAHAYDQLLREGTGGGLAVGVLGAGARGVGKCLEAVEAWRESCFETWGIGKTSGLHVTELLRAFMWLREPLALALLFWLSLVLSSSSSPLPSWELNSSQLAPLGATTNAWANGSQRAARLGGHQRDLDATSSFRRTRQGWHGRKQPEEVVLGGGALAGPVMCPCCVTVLTVQHQCGIGRDAIPILCQGGRN